MKSTVEAVSICPPFWIAMEETIPCFLSFPESLEGAVLHRVLKVPNRASP